jgi:hypothetical protein
VAKDRGWFTEYTPFQSQINGMEVKGVGTVVIPTRCSLTHSGPSAHATLRLTDVLHVPSVLCNILGMPQNCGYSLALTPEGIYGPDRQLTACFEPNRPLFILTLSEPPVGPEVGPKVIVYGMLHRIGARWTKDEWAEWKEFQRALHKGDEPLTAEEKQFLKEHYRGEYHFLLTHGLKIHDEDDRKEGRKILRTLREENEHPAKKTTVERSTQPYFMMLGSEIEEAMEKNKKENEKE